MRRVSVTDWAEGQKYRKWGMAGHIARRKDVRWIFTMMSWQPAGRRRAGGRVMEWTDAFNQFPKHKLPKDHADWRRLAQGQNHWMKLREGFADRNESST